MYYRRRQSPNVYVWVIILGILGGVLYFFFNGQQPSSEVAAAPTPTTAQQVTSPTIESTPSPAPTPTQIPQARILIPSAAVAARIIPVYLDGQSWDVSLLGENVGHLQGTAWFDRPGNVVLSGHVERADGQRGVFSSLKMLQPGDTIIVEYNQQQMRYTVIENTNVEPQDLTPLYPTTDSRLTLITCDGYDFLSNTYQERTVVIAEQAS